MIQTQINLFMNKIYEIEQKMNSNMISNNDLNSMNQNNYNPMNNIFNIYNNLNSMNQNKFNSVNNINNNLNSMNQINHNLMNNQSDNLSISVKESKTVIFRVSGKLARKITSYFVEFQDDDLISTLIEKFRKRSHFFDENAKFIFNAKNLDPYLNLTAAQRGLTDKSNIFVIVSRGIKDNN